MSRFHVSLGALFVIMVFSSMALGLLLTPTVTFASTDDPTSAVNIQSGHVPKDSTAALATQTEQIDEFCLVLPFAGGSVSSVMPRLIHLVSPMAATLLTIVSFAFLVALIQVLLGARPANNSAIVNLGQQLSGWSIFVAHHVPRSARDHTKRTTDQTSLGSYEPPPQGVLTVLRC